VPAGDIQWNCEKFLIDPDGVVVRRFSPRTERIATEVKQPCHRGMCSPQLRQPRAPDCKLRSMQITGLNRTCNGDRKSLTASDQDIVGRGL